MEDRERICIYRGPVFGIVAHELMQPWLAQGYAIDVVQEGNDVAVYATKAKPQELPQTAVSE